MMWVDVGKGKNIHFTAYMISLCPTKACLGFFGVRWYSMMYRSYLNHASTDLLIQGRWQGVIRGKGGVRSLTQRQRNPIVS